MIEDNEIIIFREVKNEENLKLRKIRPILMGKMKINAAEAEKRGLEQKENKRGLSHFVLGLKANKDML